MQKHDDLSNLVNFILQSMRFITIDYPLEHLALPRMLKLSKTQGIQALHQLITTFSCMYPPFMHAFIINLVYV